MGNLCSVVADSEMLAEEVIQGGPIMERVNSVKNSGSRGSGNGQPGARARKIRRTANMINKEYKCFHCEKFYGSEAAAIMHMRKKHNEGNK